MGKLAEIKTKENASSVEDFINGVLDEQKRKDSLTIIKLMKKVSNEQPKMCGCGPCSACPNWNSAPAWTPRAKPGCCGRPPEAATP